MTEGSGQPGNVIVLSDGATDELFSNLAFGDATEIRTLGKHVFFGIPLKSILELETIPEEEWVPEKHIMFGYMLYPGILMNITPIIMAFYSLYPVSLNKSGVRHSIYARLDLSQPGVSKHLKVLRDAGLVEVRPEGKRRWYGLRAQPLAEVDRWLAPYREYWSGRLDALERHLEGNPE